jgi:hypothetical protein
MLVLQHPNSHPTAAQSPSGTRALSLEVAWCLHAERGWISRLLEVEPPHENLASRLAQGACCGLMVFANRAGVGTVTSAVDAGGAGELSDVVAEVEVAAAVQGDVQQPEVVALIGHYCFLCDSMRIHGEGSAWRVGWLCLHGHDFRGQTYRCVRCCSSLVDAQTRHATRLPELLSRSIWRAF